MISDDVAFHWSRRGIRSDRFRWSGSLHLRTQNGYILKLHRTISATGVLCEHRACASAMHRLWFHSKVTLHALLYSLMILAPFVHEPIELSDLSCSIPPLAGEQCAEVLAQLYVAHNALSNIRGFGDEFFSALIHKLARYDYRIQLEADRFVLAGRTLLARDLHVIIAVEYVLRIR